ncbi:MAG: RsmF rRNA methyltransferase first C-terminal domain-containing protein [Solobacterium sp.]|nr:RsmF rRNA methyltransferase first C-terminal domain-containing protein [Solobacterium sp.]
MIKEEYHTQIRELLGDRYTEYLELLERTPYRAFRVNTLKIDPDHFFELSGFQQKPVPFCENGFFYEEDIPIGNQLVYDTGLIYSQEPSAMAPAELLGVQPGERVLDLCAAPGSKTTQILEKMQNRGILIANEINAKRASVLLENTIRHGAENCIVINASPAAVTRCFPQYFDKILVDAPCSGEGMFRKEPYASEQWTPEYVQECALRQSEILEQAYLCLKPGGYLVYSTCTFNTTENEGVIRGFLKQHPDMELCPEPSLEQSDSCLKLTGKGFYRIFPMQQGEGQCFCRLHRTGSAGETTIPMLKNDRLPVKQMPETDTLNLKYPYYLIRNNTIYGSHVPFPDLSGLRVIREFVRIGEMRNNRFEPDHSIALRAEKPVSSVELSDDQYLRYMHGEPLSVPCAKGWHILTWHGYGAALGRSDGTVIKNKFPKQLRKKQR